MSGLLERNAVPIITVRKSFWFGVVAGTIMVVFIITTRTLGSSQSLPELAADWFTVFLPASLLDFLLETLVFSAKPLMFAGLLIAQIIIGGLLGVLYARVAGRWPVTEPGEWGRTIGFGGVLWLLTMLMLVPLFGGGFFASKVIGGSMTFILTSVGAFAIYGIALGYFFTQAAQDRPGASRYSTRREFIKTATAWVVIGGGALFGLTFVFDRLRSQTSSSGTFRTQGILSTEVTPNDEFYIVSKNIIDPEVSLERWVLDISGLVEEPFQLTYDELIAMPSFEEFVTLECISNFVGGDLISNAKWKGVPLKRILERAKLKPGVIDISFQATDGYSESIPLEMAMRDEVMVVYQMNGEPLPFKHGFPVRLIVPGYFGLKHVKWLASIEPIDRNFKGYWQQRGWTDVPYVKTFSRLDLPRSGSEIAENLVTLGGVAFAGDRGISNVEISVNAGVTWTTVDNVSKPLSPYTWVIWTTEIVPPQEGRTLIKVRATDGEGEVQTAMTQGSLPDGATGLHDITLIFEQNPG